MGNMSPQIIILYAAILIGIFYFLLFRPQRRQKQQAEELQRMLKKGDEVVTIAGMYGTVTNIGDTWIELEIAKRTKVRFMKRAIGSIVTASEEIEEDEELIEDEDYGDESEEWVDDDEQDEPQSSDEADEAEADDDADAKPSEPDDGGAAVGEVSPAPSVPPAPKA